MNLDAIYSNALYRDGTALKTETFLSDNLCW